MAGFKQRSDRVRFALEVSAGTVQRRNRGVWTVAGGLPSIPVGDDGGLEGGKWW